jgi:hypothetical protein
MEANAAVKELRKVTEKLGQLQDEIGSKGGAVNRRRSRALAHLKQKIEREARITERLKLIEDGKSSLAKRWGQVRNPLIILTFIGMIVWLIINHGHKLAQLKR